MAEQEKIAIKLKFYRYFNVLKYYFVIYLHHTFKNDSNINCVDDLNLLCDCDFING